MTQQELPAGNFSFWLQQTRTALVNDSGTDVPCGECTACCRSYYFIHIQPKEAQTLSRIPKPLLFPAPGRPRGNVLLGYDENGRCPMLVDEKCTIYENRPLTCQNYDCRIFPATGIVPEETNKVLIRQQIHRWKFSHPTQHDRVQHNAVKAAAAFLREHTASFPTGFVPGNSTQLAILAIKVSDVFLPNNDESGKPGREKSEAEIVMAVIAANEKFEARRNSAQINQSS